MRKKSNKLEYWWVWKRRRWVFSRFKDLLIRSIRSNWPSHIGSCGRHFHLMPIRWFFCSFYARRTSSSYSWPLRLGMDKLKKSRRLLAKHNYNHQDIWFCYFLEWILKTYALVSFTASILCHGPCSYHETNLPKLYPKKKRYKKILYSSDIK